MGVCNLKIFLDDVRPAPEGWILCRWPDEVIEYLNTGKVSVVSLDHDLGDDTKGTGYDVILWIEKEVVLNNFRPPEIKLHSANISARMKMEHGIASILRLGRKS